MCQGASCTYLCWYCGLIDVYGANFAPLCGVEHSEVISCAAQGVGSALALGATVAALGLSNKAVYEAVAPPSATGAKYEDGPDLAPRPMPAAVDGPPLEEHLAQNTLWPEIVKLYGHASEVFCLAADPRGEFLVSACKVRFAAISMRHPELLG